LLRRPYFVSPPRNDGTTKQIMQVTINNKQTTISTLGKVDEVFAFLNIPNPKGIAIAVNNNVLPKSEWTSFTIKENDKITVIRATQGG
jgi:sulfur carrier protein